MPRLVDENNRTLDARAIEVRDLHKSFGANRAVDGVSFCARDGEITGLLGPNGAGKTTTLRMLYTLMRPDAGTILVDGRDAQQEPLAVRRSLGALPDARGLYKRLTARENIEFFAALHGLTAAEARSRSDALIKTLAMQEFAGRRTVGSEAPSTVVSCCRLSRRCAIASSSSRTAGSWPTARPSSCGRSRASRTWKTRS